MRCSDAAIAKYGKLFCGQISERSDGLTLSEKETVSESFPDMSQVIAAAYFTRVWVAQEIILGKSVVCQLGDFTFSVAALLAAFELWDPLFFDKRHVDDICSRYLRPSLIGLPGRASAGPGTQDMAIVELFGDRKCSDPKDHIYGLSALFEHPSACVIDYSPSAAEVFCNFTVQCLRASNDCSVFSSYRSGGRKSVTDIRFALPSWCPSWTTVRHKANRELAAKSEARWRASGQRKISFKRPSALVITLKGYLISRVMWRSTDVIFIPFHQDSAATVITETVEYLLGHPQHAPSSMGSQDLALS